MNHRGKAEKQQQNEILCKQTMQHRQLLRIEHQNDCMKARAVFRPILQAAIWPTGEMAGLYQLAGSRN